MNTLDLQDKLIDAKNQARYWETQAQEWKDVAVSHERLARYWAAAYRKAVSHDGRIIDTLTKQEAHDGAAE